MKEYIKWRCSKTLDHDNETLGDKVSAAGLPDEWSLTQGIYYVLISWFFLVGFGDLWPYYTHHSEGEHNHNVELCGCVFQILLIVCVLAVVSSTFDAVSNHVDRSIDNEIVSTYRKSFKRNTNKNSLRNGNLISRVDEESEYDTSS